MGLQPSPTLLRARPTSPHPRNAGANRCAVWLAALTAVGRLVGRQVLRPVFAPLGLRRGLRSLSRATGVDSCHPSPLLRSYAEPRGLSLFRRKRNSLARRANLSPGRAGNISRRQANLSQPAEQMIKAICGASRREIFSLNPQRSLALQTTPPPGNEIQLRRTKSALRADDIALWATISSRCAAGRGSGM